MPLGGPVHAWSHASRVETVCKHIVSRAVCGAG
jgi:hypothetical protein